MVHIHQDRENGEPGCLVRQDRTRNISFSAGPEKPENGEKNTDHNCAAQCGSYQEEQTQQQPAFKRLGSGDESPSKSCLHVGHG